MVFISLNPGMKRYEGEHGIRHMFYVPLYARARPSINRSVSGMTEAKKSAGAQSFRKIFYFPKQKTPYF